MSTVSTNEWLKNYTDKAVFSALVFRVCDMKTRAARSVTVDVFEGFEIEVAENIVKQKYPSHNTAVLGACRVVEDSRGVSVPEATLNPEYISAIRSGRLGSEVHQWLMTALSDALERWVNVLVQEGRMLQLTEPLIHKSL